MPQIVVISGRICTGKSALAKELSKNHNFKVFRTSEILKEKAKEEEIALTKDKLALQKFGDKLDEDTESKWLFNEIEKYVLANNAEVSIVVDHVRTFDQLKYFREKSRWLVTHVHLYASNKATRKRYQDKKDTQNLDLSYEDADPVKNDLDIEMFKNDADVRIFTDRTDNKDTYVRVAARLGLFSPPRTRLVDVLVGGQYGSEGKGHIASYLAREYDVLIRVGGPNAGHTVLGVETGERYTHHLLPSGCSDVQARVLLGPGMTINLPNLLDEIRDCKLDTTRLFIDPQAIIIEEEDIEKEKGNLRDEISSTASGSGAASARRILERKPTGNIRLARNVEELQPYIGSTVDQLELAYSRGERVMLEGTQGSALSIFHGDYPHVTSRDTNVAGCLAEAGISPSRVRRVIMVVRYTPIRVQSPSGEGKTSGKLKHETDWKEIAENATYEDHKSYDENEAAALELEKILRKAEKTSTTKKDRRVAWFDWEQFRKACALNAPTDIVLTFTDYIHISNRKARRFDQLTEDTIKFIEEIERVAQAPVSLINTRFPQSENEDIFDLRTIIDRRNWKGSRKSM